MITTIKEIGEEIEFNAKTILKDNFKNVEWVSKKYPYSPYDFICANEGKKLFIDVKNCLDKKVIISKNKLNNLKKGKFGNFYFMLRVEKLTFNLIHFEELLKNKEYKIILKENIKTNICIRNFSLPEVRRDNGKIKLKLTVIKMGKIRRFVEIPKDYYEVVKAGDKVTLIIPDKKD